MNTPWPPSHIGTLRTRWADGVTAQAIADELGGGLTKCAVCGKVRRLGLPKRREGSAGPVRKSDGKVIQLPPRRTPLGMPRFSPVLVVRTTQLLPPEPAPRLTVVPRDPAMSRPQIRLAAQRFLAWRRTIGFCQPRRAPDPIDIDEQPDVIDLMDGIG